MPLTDPQADVIRILASTRTPSAYLSGVTLSSVEGPRYSVDIDFFHDEADLALSTFQEDARLLSDLGYEVAPIGRPNPGFVRAVVSKDGNAVKIDWAHEAAWHFFQPIPDPDFGFRLHWADAATNKVLAFASRREPRDIFDTLQWHEKRLHLGALVWAASGKDVGLPPGMILEEIRRNAKISPPDLATLSFSESIDPADIGSRFRQAIREAEEMIESLPPETSGSLFLNAEGHPINPDVNRPETLKNMLHPSQGGLVPQIQTDDPSPL